MSVGKKNILIAIVLCISITVIGVSFAYFTSSVKVTGDGASVSGTTAELIKVTYDAGDAVSLQNAIPGNSLTKAFTIKIEPTANEDTVTYAIILDITTNGFTKCVEQTTNNMCNLNAEELTYTLRNGTDVLASGDLTGTTGEVTLLKETKTAETTTTLNYTLEITYEDTEADQNHNANKTFDGKLKVEFAEAE